LKVEKIKSLCPVNPSAPEDLPAGYQGKIAIVDKLIKRLSHPSLPASWGAIVFDYHFLSFLAPTGAKKYVKCLILSTFREHNKPRLVIRSSAN